MSQDRSNMSIVNSNDIFPSQRKHPRQEFRQGNRCVCQVSLGHNTISRLHFQEQWYVHLPAPAIYPPFPRPCHPVTLAPPQPPTHPSTPSSPPHPSTPPAMHSSFPAPPPPHPSTPPPPPHPSTPPSSSHPSSPSHPITLPCSRHPLTLPPPQPPSFLKISVAVKT